MATVTPQVIAASGTALTLAAASAGGDTIAAATSPNNVPATLVVKTSGTATTVTFTSVKPCSQGVTHNVAVSVGATAEEHIPVPSQAVDPVLGSAAITYSATTSVTVGAYY